MRCEICDTEIPAGATECPHCGFEVKWMRGDESTQELLDDVNNIEGNMGYSPRRSTYDSTQNIQEKVRCVQSRERDAHKRKRAIVSSSLIRNTVIGCKGALIEEEQTKTLASRRDITLVESTRPYLQALYDRRMAQGMLSDKVCAYEDGRAVKPDYISRHVKEFLERCGAPNMRLHDLRHTAATVLVKRMPVIYVTAFLGHNQVSTTTDIYSHVLEGERQKASAAMDAYLGSVGFCSESCSETDKNAGVN